MHASGDVSGVAVGCRACTCRALTRARPNTGTPYFRTFGPGTRTWPVFAQRGGGGVTSHPDFDSRKEAQAGSRGFGRHF